MGNRYARTIPHVATDALWPRPLVVVASPQAWARLSEADRDALVEAGRLAAGPVLDSVRESERSAIPQLCRQGARFFGADVADLRRAVEPVYAAIRRDATAARVLAAIEGLRSTDAGEPLACPAGNKTAAAGLPPGTYTWTITRAEALKVPGIEKDPGFLAELPAAFRAVIEPGHIVIYVSSRGGEEEIGLEADISVFEDRVEFDEGNAKSRQTARWSLEGDDLRFTDVRDDVAQAGQAGSQVVMGTKAWRRVR